MKKIKPLSLYLSLFLISFIALPVMAASINTFKELADRAVNTIIGPIVPLLIGLAVLVFLYGVLTFTFSEGGTKKEEGKQYMIWGIVGLFVMVSVWGLVAILQGTFNLDNKTQNIKMEIPNVTITKGS
jgi:membrane protease YdiL (CAAX protease family)